MLNSETSLRAGTKTETSNSPATSQEEVAEYIQNFAAELQVLSQKAGLTFLSYLLSMVVLSARDVIASGQELKSEND